MPTIDIINILSQHIIVSLSIVKISTLGGPENDAIIYPYDICWSPTMGQSLSRNTDVDYGSSPGDLTGQQRAYVRK